MSATQYDIPNISIDVVPLFLNKQDSRLYVVLGRRQFEPFLNEFALPGVLLKADERLDDAARRALRAKAFFLNNDIDAVLDLGTFDNPDRDPRGATVSIAKIATVGKAFAPNNSNSVRVVPIDDIAGDDAKVTLPFDHNNIILHAAVAVSEKLMRNREFTHALLGAEFSTSNIRGVLEQIGQIAEVEVQADFSNLSRALKATGWLERADGLTSDDSTVDSYSYTTGQGRPSARWSWV